MCVWGPLLVVVVLTVIYIDINDDRAVTWNGKTSLRLI